MTGERIRTVIADDQELVRGGFTMILEAQPDIEVVGEAADGAEAIAATLRHRPDVVLMDIRMPNMDGIEATRRICAGSQAKVLILTTYDADDYVYDALCAGASGFLLKDVRREDLVHAVRVVARGDSLLAPAITGRVIAEYVRSRPGAPVAATDINSLTARERETLALIARGCSNAEIADALTVSEHTVKTHVSNVLMKLGLRDRIHAVIRAYETGVVLPGQGSSG